LVPKDGLVPRRTRRRAAAFSASRSSGEGFWLSRTGEKWSWIVVPLMLEVTFFGPGAAIGHFNDSEQLRLDLRGGWVRQGAIQCATRDYPNREKNFFCASETQVCGGVPEVLGYDEGQKQLRSHRFAPSGVRARSMRCANVGHDWTVTETGGLSPVVFRQDV